MADPAETLRPWLRHSVDCPDATTRLEHRGRWCGCRLFAALASLTTDAGRDARMAAENDRVWGEGQWVRCSCQQDDAGRDVYHHHGAHASLTRPTLTDEERADVEAEREDRCHCHESYTSRNLVAPDCHHEDIDVLLRVIDRLTEDPE